MMILKKGKQPNTLVTKYHKGLERPYMINLYGGRLVAMNLSDSDLEYILELQSMVKEYKKLIK